jgi:hypothetical protein
LFLYLTGERSGVREHGSLSDGSVGQSQPAREREMDLFFGGGNALRIATRTAIGFVATLFWLRCVFATGMARNLKIHASIF